MQSPQTLFDKLWRRHVVAGNEDGEALLYIDRHLVYEVTSPQAFEGLALDGRKPWRRETVLATVDHNVPTTRAERAGVDAIADPLSRMQVRQLDVNCREFGITEFGITSKQQGIIHVIGPEQGATLPGMTVVAGDSHTSTHGAFAALAFGVGTSEVEHVLATQTLAMRRYLDRGEPGQDVSKRPQNPAFALNQPRYAGARILLTRENFGCGSSREHAPWALRDWGIRALIAPSFADIFHGNCFKNGMLPIVLDAATVDRLFVQVGSTEGLRVRIDLAAQTATPDGGAPIPFAIDASRKHRLLNGLDDIGLTLQRADRIRAYEAQRRQAEPWLFLDR
jgi:3-isopropylmalate dehydratase small subunit